VGEARDGGRKVLLGERFAQPRQVAAGAFGRLAQRIASSAGRPGHARCPRDLGRELRPVMPGMS
jgi:hypothetical protein